VLAGGTGAVLVARSAGYLLGLDVEFAIDLRLPPGRRRVLDGVVIHRLRLKSEDITRISGFDLTTIPRTLADLAAMRPFVPIEHVVDNALARRLVSATTLIDYCKKHPGMQGVPTLRELLAIRPNGRPRFRSGVERVVLGLVHDAGLGDVVPNFKTIDANGNERFLDLAWPEHKVAIEFDSFRWHTGRRDWAADRNRANALIACGWRIVWATDADVEDRLRTPIATVRALLSR
jgi:hypothetical protein